MCIHLTDGFTGCDKECDDCEGYIEDPMDLLYDDAFDEPELEEEDE